MPVIIPLVVNPVVRPYFWTFWFKVADTISDLGVP